MLLKRKEKKIKINSFRNNVISTQISQICNGMHQCQNSNTKKKKKVHRSESQTCETDKPRSFPLRTDRSKHVNTSNVLLKKMQQLHTTLKRNRYSGFWISHRTGLQVYREYYGSQSSYISFLQEQSWKVVWSLPCCSFSTY